MPTKVVPFQSPSYLFGEYEEIKRGCYPISNHSERPFGKIPCFVEMGPRHSLINALSLDSVDLSGRKIEVCSYNIKSMMDCVYIESRERVNLLEKELIEIVDFESDSNWSELMAKGIDGVRKKNKEKLMECRGSRENVILNFTPTFIQKGCTCKLAALANVNDFYFMHGLTDQWIPVNKKVHRKRSSFPENISPEKVIKIEGIAEENSGLIAKTYHDRSCLELSIGDIGRLLKHEISYLKEVKAHLLQARIRMNKKNKHAESLKSIRQLAKSLGSAQGEVVSPEKLSDIGSLIGLKSKVIKCDDVDVFRKFAIEELNNNHPVMTFTQGFPHMEDRDRTASQWQEHAIVLIGYKCDEDAFIYTDYGSKKEIAAEKLWCLMSSVPEKREEEFFLKVEPDAKDVSFCSDINRGQVRLSAIWHDCHQVLDQRGCYPRVNKTVYFEYNEAGEMILDRDGLGKLDLTRVKGIRKSLSPSAEDSNFVRTLMVFTPEGVT